jgi:UDP-N-acetylmuramate dehydrogenase
MASTNVLAELKGFADFIQTDAPLAPFTQLKIGGPAEVLILPRSLDELRAVLKRCFDRQLRFRILGSGGNVLVHDEGVKGIILRLATPAFTQITTDGSRLKAGSGATLSAVIAHATHHGLAGLETLVGLPGTIGGALLLNAGDRTSDIGQFVRRVEVLDSQASVQMREHDELRFTSNGTILDDPVLLSAEFDLEPERPESIVKRLRKSWIQFKATQPFSYQSAARIFKNPPGLNAAALIEQTGLVGTKVGAAMVSDRNPNYIIVESGAAARDVLRLIDLIRTRVEDRFHLELELAISVW